MKKWEIVVIVAFFAVFIILFFSVEQPWQPKTSKVGEMTVIDDVYVQINPPLVEDSLSINFRNAHGFNFKDYEAGTGWKFVIIDIWVSNHARENRSFYVGWIEDENGMIYYDYHLEEVSEGTPYLLVYPYKDLVELAPDDGEWISIAYKMPTNAVPEKFHYSIHNSDYRFGEVILKR